MYALELISASGARRRIEITKERALIGRSLGCEARIDQAGVPPVLATLIQSMGDIFLVSHSEKLLALVNGVPAGRHNLRNGDRISVGNCELILRHEGPAPKELTEKLLELAGLPASALAPSPLLPLSEQQPDLSPFLAPKPSPAEPLSAPGSLAPKGGEAPAEPDGHALPEPAAPAGEELMEGTQPDPALAAPAVAAPATEQAPPPNAWASLTCVSGNLKGKRIFLDQALALIELGGCKALVALNGERSHMTILEGPAPFIGKQRAGAGMNVLASGTLLAFSGSVFHFQLLARASA